MTVLDIYTRVSRKGDERQLSVRGQAKHCRSVVAKAGAEVGQEFSDPGKSAWRKGVRRPDWEALMTRLESGESDGVVVYDLSRFARQVRDGERLIDVAERGVKVLDSESAFDLTSPDGKAAFRDQIRMAAYYSDRISKNVRRGKKLRAIEGQPNGSHRAFGFEPDSITHRADEVTALRDWGVRLLRGETQASILEDAVEQDIFSATGRPMSAATFRTVMTSPRYGGWIEYKGERVSRLPGEPVFDEVTYARLVALFDGRKRGRPVGRYMCTGYVFCRLCGGKLTGRTHHGKPQYYCQDTGHNGILARTLDEWAADWMVRELADPAHANNVAAEAAKLSEHRAELDREAASIEAILDDLSAKLAADLPAAVRAGRADRVRARHARATEPLEARMVELSAELDSIALVPDPNPGRTIPDRDMAYLYWLDQWERGTTGERRQILTHALGGRVIVVESGRGTDRIKVRKP